MSEAISKYMDIREYIAHKKDIIDKALDKYLPLSSVRPQIIHRAMRYSVFPGGKRIRPIFTIAGFEPLTETIVRNDKIGIIIWTDKPLGTIIHQKEAAESYDKFFQLMWKSGSR